MSEYVSKKNIEARAPEPQNDPGSSRFVTDGVPNSSVEAVLRGSAASSPEMMGHRENLAQSVEAKMSRAFGMDLSQMKLYRTDAMTGSDMKGLSSGNRIVLSRDVDLNTLQGQQILGHEISHLHAQSQGIGLGHTGLYENAGLEHQADAEGAMAARGLNIDGSSPGMISSGNADFISSLTPLGSGMSASAGAPMQADKRGGKKKAKPRKKVADAQTVAPDGDLSHIKPNKAGIKQILEGAGFVSGSKKDKVKARCYVPTLDKLTDGDWTYNQENPFTFSNYIDETTLANQDQMQRDKWNQQTRKNGADTKNIGGTLLPRVLNELGVSSVNGGMDKEELDELANSLITEEQGSDGMNAAQKKLRLMRYQQLKRYKGKYGHLFEQLDPHTITSEGSQKDFWCDFYVGQSLRDATHGSNVTLDDAEQEEEYQKLEEYYTKAGVMATAAGNMATNEDRIFDSKGEFDDRYTEKAGIYRKAQKELRELSGNVNGGKKMTDAQYRVYLNKVKKDYGENEEDYKQYEEEQKRK